MSEEFAEEQLKAFFKTKAGREFLSEEMSQAFKYVLWHSWKQLPDKVRQELARTVRQSDKLQEKIRHLQVEKEDLEQSISRMKAELEEYVPARVIARMKGSKNV